MLLSDEDGSRGAALVSAGEGIVMVNSQVGYGRRRRCTFVVLAMLSLCYVEGSAGTRDETGN